jgi:hypothetical protein
MLSCIYADDPSGQLGLIVGQMQGEGNSDLRFSQLKQCPVIIPLKQVRLWSSTHKADGTPLLSRRQFIVEVDSRIGFDVEKYLDAMQRVLEQQKIYIAYVITHSRQRDIDNAYYVLKFSMASNNTSKRRLSLVCFHESTSRPTTVLHDTEIVGTVGQYDLEVHFTEHTETTGPDPSLCRAIFSRSTQDPSILSIELRCSCGRNCRQRDPTYSKYERWMRCDGYGIHVNASLRTEQRSGRNYNTINFDVSFWQVEGLRGFLKSNTWD